MRTLYIHVGQDKTGSSYIQSSLAASVEYLKSQDIFYPTNNKILKAKDGKISSGNQGLLNPNSEREYKDIVDSNSILISGEQLFRHLPDKDNTNDFKMFIEKFAITEVKILLFIREPVEHASSAYQQAIKRGGYTLSFEEFATKYTHTKKVFDFIKYCERNQTFKLEIKNYSQRKSTILEVFESWLEIPVTSLVRPEQKIINRSMTRAELEFQRTVNIHLGKKASFISDALCEKVPDLKADKVIIPLDVQKKLISKLKVYCDYINQYAQNLGNSDVYEFIVSEEVESSTNYNFNKQQIEVIASSMAIYFEQCNKK